MLTLVCILCLLTPHSLISAQDIEAQIIQEQPKQQENREQKNQERYHFQDLVEFPEGIVQLI